MAEERAAWCLVSGQRWDDWLHLTQVERQAFVDMAREASRRR
jgi:hypothetical protein